MDQNSGGGGGGGGGGESVGASSSFNKVLKKKKATADFFPDKAHVTDELRAILARLDASDPMLIYEKHMPLSDRRKHQNRLLMSCKSLSKKMSCKCIFTETETPLVHPPGALKTTTEDDDHGGGGGGGGKDKAGKGRKKKKKKKDCKVERKKKDSMGNYEEDEDDDNNTDDTEQGNKQTTSKSVVAEGLAVQAYDRDGRVYELNLKYLSSNGAYRIIGPDYGVFLKNNGLLVDDGTRKRPAAAGLQKRRQSGGINLLTDEEESDSDADEQPAVPVRDVVVADDIQIELWAFRSPNLSFGTEKDQPAGALGLLLLHYRAGREGQIVGAAGAAATEEAVAPQDQQDEVVVVDEEETKTTQHKTSHGMTAAQAGDGMVAAGDSSGEQEEDAGDRRGSNDAAGKPLGPAEKVLAVVLSLDDPSVTTTPREA